MRAPGACTSAHTHSYTSRQRSSLILNHRRRPLPCKGPTRTRAPASARAFACIRTRARSVVLDSAHARAHLRKRVVYRGENTRATALIARASGHFQILAIESACREAPLKDFSIDSGRHLHRYTYRASEFGLAGPRVPGPESQRFDLLRLVVMGLPVLGGPGLGSVGCSHSLALGRTRAAPCSNPHMPAHIYASE